MYLNITSINLFYLLHADNKYGGGVDGGFYISTSQARKHLYAEEYFLDGDDREQDITNLLFNAKMLDEN